MPFSLLTPTLFHWNGRKHGVKRLVFSVYLRFSMSSTRRVWTRCSEGHSPYERSLLPRCFQFRLVESLTALLTIVMWKMEPQAWGVAYDGTHLFVTDGSPKMHVLNPASMQVTGQVTITYQGYNSCPPVPGFEGEGGSLSRASTAPPGGEIFFVNVTCSPQFTGKPVPKINDMEFVPAMRKIIANRWFDHRLAIIDPRYPSCALTPPTTFSFWVKSCAANLWCLLKCRCDLNTMQLWSRGTVD